MEVKEIDLSALIARIAAGETTANDAAVIVAILEMAGLLPSNPGRYNEQHACAS